VSALNWVNHHRFWTIGIGATVLIVSVIAGLWFFILRNPSTQVNLRQALHLYRLNQKKDKTGSNRLPVSGVYRYQTDGWERLSFAGIHRSFPTTTNMIVTEARCATMKWEPLVQHMEGMVLCRQDSGGLTITSAPSYEQIAGTQTTSTIRCPVGTFLIPPNPRPHERWHTICHGPGQKVIFSGQVIGASFVQINGHHVPAMHTRLSLDISGSESGTNPTDYWVSSNGLILRQFETVDVSQQAGPLGSVRYTEQMSIKLTATVPIR
jgi:hypothetical protein